MLRTGASGLVATTALGAQGATLLSVSNASPAYNKLVTLTATVSGRGAPPARGLLASMKTVAFCWALPLVGVRSWQRTITMKISLDRAGPSQGSPLCPDDRFTPFFAEFRYRLSENHDRALGAAVPDHEYNGQLSNGSESAG